MAGGRPRIPGTEEERAALRRKRVLRNVHRFRARQRDASSASGSTLSSAASPAQAETHVIASNYRIDISVPEEIIAADASAVPWPSLRFPFQLHFGPTYRDAFISSFLHGSSVGSGAAKHLDVRGFLPVNLCCGSWLRSIYHIARPEQFESQILSDLLLASALREFGESRDDTAIKSFALETHAKVTQALTRHVVNFQNGKTSIPDPHLLASSILAFAMAELVVHRDWQRFLTHLRGAGAIMESLGPEQLTTAVARRHFNGYRCLELTFSMLYHQRTFPCDPKWSNLPNLGPYSAMEPFMSQFIDICYHLPSELELFDRIHVEDHEATHSQLERVCEISKLLAEWRLTVSSQDPWTLETDPDGNNAKYSVHFPTDSVANLNIAFCGAYITSKDLEADVANRLSHHGDVNATSVVTECLDEASDWIQRALCTIQTFLDTQPWSIGKVNTLSALDAAWHTSIKRGLATHVLTCEDLARRLDARGLPVFRTHQYQDRIKSLLQ